MAHRNTLTQQQLDVLRWVADGCADGVMEGYSHRISAAALRGRGLVNTSGRDETWTATITPAGRDHLEHAQGPDGPRPRQPNTSLTQPLIDEIIAAGGTLRVPRHNCYDPDSVDYERRAQLAKRHGKVPPGQWLTVTKLRDELELRLEDDPGAAHEPTPDLVAVPVPARIARHHPAACAFRDNRQSHEVSRALVSRATRIVHAIATEAQRRGWVADAADGAASTSPPTPLSCTFASARRECTSAHRGRRTLTAIATFAPTPTSTAT
jgi:hypothetical protein